MQSLGSIFVNRPVMATAINLVLLIVGLVAFEKLELRHKPNQPTNEVQIRTIFPGASALSVEQRVTKPLEDALSGINGIRKITSTSVDNMSQIQVKFKSNIEPDKALSQVRDRIFAITGSLPDTVKRPSIEESSENYSPIIYIGFEDKTRSTAALSDFLRRNVEDRLRLLDGVSEIQRFGNQVYMISVRIDPARLMEHQVSVSEVIHALQGVKSFAAGGELETQGGKQTVMLAAEVNDPSEYGDIVVKQIGSEHILVKDVADIKVAHKPTFVRIRVNGQDVIGLGVIPKPQANPLKVADTVKKFVDTLKKSLPESIHAYIFFDATTPFLASFTELHHTFWEAILLVGLIVTISLASLRAALLPMITVPLCLIGTFALMWILGFSINPVTLLALILAVGLVVDDAIVVVENIHRHMEEGMTALQAARAGMKEITFAVIVMSITLAAVYLPIAFSSDESSIMFKEFAWTLAGSVLISGFVALTLTPALCGRWLKDHKKMTTWDRITTNYQYWLEKSLKYPGRIVFGLIVIALLGVWGFARLPVELIPVEDESEVNGYIVNPQNPIPKALKEDWFKEIEKVLDTVPEKVRYFTGIWQEQYMWWWMSLEPANKRDKGLKQIVKELKPKLDKIIGPTVGTNYGQGGLGGEEPLKVMILYSGDYQTQIKILNKIIDELKASQKFQNILSEQAQQKFRIKLVVDRSLASELGVSISSIEDTLYTFLSGRKATEFNFNGQDYDVEVRGGESVYSELSAMNSFFVLGAEGSWIPLGSLVTPVEVQESTQIKHYERMRGGAISITLKPDMSLAEAIQIAEPIVKKNLPYGTIYKFGGKAERYKEARMAMWFTFGLSFVFIYLVLAALFESFIHPFIVLLTVPLSVTGAIWVINALPIGTNNVYTTIGLVTLAGLISKHGILIVDFANRLRAAGKTVREAVLLAGVSRIRPVLMTTLAMIFGALPLIFSEGAGAIARKHIGWIIIGGMITGTVFSLFVIPVVYRLVIEGHGWRDLWRDACRDARRLFTVSK